MLWVLFGVTFDEAAAERTARVDADRNCCLADLLAAGRASLRRKTLPTELMVMVEFCKIKVRLPIADEMMGLCTVGMVGTYLRYVVGVPVSPAHACTNSRSNNISTLSLFTESKQEGIELKELLLLHCLTNILTNKHISHRFLAMHYCFAKNQQPHTTTLLFIPESRFYSNANSPFFGDESQTLCSAYPPSL